jgi:hypothetical protein
MVIHDASTITQLLMVFAFLIAAFVILPCVYLTVGRKFDKLFKDKQAGLFDFDIPFLSYGMRAAAYAFCVIFKYKSSKDPFLSMAYQGYNFKEHANRLEIALSFLFVISCLIGFVSTILNIVLKLM